MAKEIGIRELDEWIYGINKVAAELDEQQQAELVKILGSLSDQMREMRGQLLVLRRNEIGY